MAKCVHIVNASGRMKFITLVIKLCNTKVYNKQCFSSLLYKKGKQSSGISPVFVTLEREREKERDTLVLNQNNPMGKIIACLNPVLKQNKLYT
jgi:hypothetical protein